MGTVGDASDITTDIVSSTAGRPQFRHCRSCSRCWRHHRTVGNPDGTEPTEMATVLSEYSPQYRQRYLQFRKHRRWRRIGCIAGSVGNVADSCDSVWPTFEMLKLTNNAEPAHRHRVDCLRFASRNLSLLVISDWRTGSPSFRHRA